MSIKANRITTVLTALMLGCSFVPGQPFENVFRNEAIIVSAAESIDYLDFNVSTDSFEQKTCDNCMTVTGETLTLTDGWYVVSGIVTCDSRIFISGDVKLILEDGCSMEAKKGINVDENSSLTIYAQSSGTGELKAEASESDAGIGSSNNGACGTITINGGDIYASGGNNGAGIGSGNNGACGTITINGGDIYASGGENAAGIGSGSCDSETASHSGTVIINDGIINATGGKNGAAIGGGKGRDAGDITINGCCIILNGGNDAPCIGAGKDGNGGTVTVCEGIELIESETENVLRPSSDQSWSDFFREKSSISFRTETFPELKEVALKLDGSITVMFRFDKDFNEDDGWTINGTSIFTHDKVAEYAVAAKDFMTDLVIRCGDIRKITIRVDNIINRYKNDFDTMEIACALEEYCKAANAYFAGRPVQAPSDITQDSIKNAIEEANNYVSISKKAASLDTSYFATSLLLRSKTIIRHYFLDNVPGSTKNGNLYYIQDDNGVPAHLYFDPDNYCVNDYIYQVLTSRATDNNIKNLCAALYKYGKAARKYYDTPMIG